MLRTVTPDIVLLDVNLNGENCFALCRKLKDKYPEIQVLVVSAYGDAHLLQKSIRAGASGYALKSVSMMELPVAIRHLDEKGTYFSPSLSEYVLNSLGKTAVEVSELSPREEAIIRLIGRGLDKLGNRTRAGDQRSHRKIPRQSVASAASISPPLRVGKAGGSTHVTFEPIVTTCGGDHLPRRFVGAPTGYRHNGPKRRFEAAP